MRIKYLEVATLRSYGSDPQRIDFTGPLAVIHAENSQGKSGLAESLEFLFTGTTSRRTLTGGSPSEFEGSLRNVHAPEDSPAYVEVGLDLGDSKVTRLRRELTADYVGAADCTSVLFLDGQKIESVESAGFRLSSPPLAAPVLLEHTLRYSVSAKPGERSDYFKAILEVSDLELVRQEVLALISTRAAESPPKLLLTLRTLCGEASFGTELTPISMATDEATARSALAAACQAVTDVGERSNRDAPSLEDALEQLNEHIAAAQRSSLPLADLESVAEEAPPEVVEKDVALLVKAYSDRHTTVDALASAIVPILRAALNVDLFVDVDASHPVDCPLCRTENAITEQRLLSIRQQVADQEQLSAEAQRLSSMLKLESSRLSSYSDRLKLGVPKAAGWSEDERSVFLELATGLGDVDGTLESALAAAEVAARVVELLADAAGEAAQFLETIAEQVDNFKKPLEQDVVGASVALGVVKARAAELVQVRLDLETARIAVVGAIGRQAAELSGTETWMQLAELASSPAEVFKVVREDAARSRVDSQLKLAARQIDRACQKVLDDRLEAMSATVSRWWLLLRPGEATSFEALTRRGSGQQYLDLTASLRPENEGPGAVRKALAILSNSQLNALGLAAFLARAQLMDSKFVVLDDPVQSTDPEHRLTFAHGVIEQLLANGNQVLVTTFDSHLARLLQTLHRHLQVDEFKATLLNPSVGTEIVRTGDDFERLMLDASSQLPSPLEANRRSAGNSLRIAAERLAKQVVIAGRRREGKTAQLADFDGKNLKDLRPLAIGFALDAREPGQWGVLARTLNDADHDTLDPPKAAELKSCMEMLKEIKKRHVDNDRSLMAV